MDKYILMYAREMTQKSLKSQKSGDGLGLIDSWTFGSQKFFHDKNGYTDKYLRFFLVGSSKMSNFAAETG